MAVGGLVFVSAAFAFEGMTARLLGSVLALLLTLAGGRLYGNPWATLPTPAKDTWSPKRRSVFLLTAILTPVAAFATVVSGLIVDGLNPVVLAFLLITACSFVVLLLLPLDQES